jgi:hypothetical protein
VSASDAIPPHLPSQERFARKLRVRVKQGITAEREAVQGAWGQKAVQDETALTQCEHDFTWPDVFQ